jgi:sulfatase maturation enzyme AslB (radical SAM superfamily)
LKNIWFGKNRNIYQKKLKKNKLKQVGCLQCLNDIRQKNFDAVNSSRYEPFTDSISSKFPSVMGFRFTDKCNINCIMCLSNHNVTHSNMQTEKVYDDNFFKDLETFIPHLKYAYFLGGEPFFELLNYRVFDLFDKLNPACRVSVQTNGTILNDKIRKYLRNGNFDINISIDSLQGDVFESIRKGAKFNTIMENLHVFKGICDERGTAFSTCFTPMRMNWQELPDIIGYYNKELHSRVWINKYYFPVRYAIWALSSVEIEKIISSLKEVKFAVNDEISENNVVQFDGYIQVLKAYYQDALEREEDSTDHTKDVQRMLNKLKRTVRRSQGVYDADRERIIGMFEEISCKDTNKLYYYLIKLHKILAGDKLLEILSDFDKDYISEDLNQIYL